MQMKLNLCSKELEPKVNYIEPQKQILIGKEDDFLAREFTKEVINLSKKQKKRITKICSALLTTSTSFFVLATPAFAETAIPATTNPETFMPKDIAQIGLYLIGLCTVASTILAIILTQLSGGYRMLGKGDKATEWTTNILKGYTQVILAPVIIITIAFVSYLMFGNFQWFVKPF